MADFQGKDGSITVAGVALDQVVDWALSDVSFIEVNTTVKGDLATEAVGGLVESGRWRATCNLDKVTGQEDIIDLFAGTPDGSVVAVVLIVATGKSFAFSSVPPKWSVTSPEPESTTPVQITFDGKVSGLVSIAWV